MKAVAQWPVMMIKMRAYLAILFSIAVLHSTAQIEDTRLRQRIGITYDLNKKWSFKASFRLDNEHNMVAFRRSNFDLTATYKVNKWLNGIANYRFGTSHTSDFHRIRLGINASKNINKKSELSLRSLLQHSVNFIDADYLSSYNPKWIWRNKLSYSYDLSSKMKLELNDELFANRFRGSSYFYRNRIGASFNYTYKRRHHFMIGYFLQNDFNIKSPEIVQVINTDYTFDIIKKKKKKKKKKSVGQTKEQ